MNGILTTSLVSVLIDERQATAARNRRVHQARATGPIRWHWWGPRNTLPRHRHGNPIAAASTKAAE